jgi:hypothetical protein
MTTTLMVARMTNRRDTAIKEINSETALPVDVLVMVNLLSVI